MTIMLRGTLSAAALSVVLSIAATTGIDRGAAPPDRAAPLSLDNEPLSPLQATAGVRSATQIETPVNFEISVNSGGVDMTWTEASPDTEKFVLRHSTDLMTWVTLAEFPPTQVAYHVHTRPIPDTPNFYRLIAVSK